MSQQLYELGTTNPHFTEKEIEAYIEGLGNLFKSTRLVNEELEMKSRQRPLKPASLAMMLGWHTVGFR